MRACGVVFADYCIVDGIGQQEMQSTVALSQNAIESHQRRPWMAEGVTRAVDWRAHNPMWVYRDTKDRFLMQSKASCSYIR